MSDEAGRTKNIAALERHDGERNSIAVHGTREPASSLFERFTAANMTPLPVHPLNDRGERFRMIG
jgi:hypothetical protein